LTIVVLSKCGFTHKSSLIANVSV